jgi:hypothetical protein
MPQTKSESSVRIERAALERVAATVLGEGERLDHLTDREVRERALAGHFRVPVNLQHRSDEYVAGVFDAVLAGDAATTVDAS